MKCNNHRRTLAIVLAVAMFLNIVLYEGIVAATDTTSVTHRLIAEERISEGTQLFTYELQRNGNSTNTRILEVDLRNPYVEIRALSSAKGFNDRKTVLEMAKEQGAIAAINADFFRMDQPAAPFGLHIEDGELLSAPAHLGHWQGFGVDDLGIAQIMNWTFQGKVIFSDKHTYELFGYNQPEHYPWSGNSHGNRINLYDRHWGEQVPGTFFGQPMLKVTVVENSVVSWKMDNQPVPIPENGYVLVADGAGANFLNMHVEVGKEIALEYGLTPDTNLKTAVGGHALLVENGKAVQPLKVTMVGRSARSAVGMDTSGKTVYFIAIDASPNLQGLTLDELAKFLAELGMDRAMNLDGGGSSTMVAQDLGEFSPEVINRLMYGTQRRLPNAIGIFNRAPVGDPDTLLIHGEPGVLLGTEAKYSVTGYDRHYHPLVIDNSALVWEVTDNANAIKTVVSGGVLKGIQAGESNLRVSYKGISAEKKVKVYGFNDIKNVKINPEEIQLLPGQSISLTAKVEMVDGRILNAGKETVNWSTDFGRLENNVYYASDREGSGTLTASIDGFRKEVPVRIGGLREPFFTFREWQSVSFRGHPETLQGDFVMETNPDYIYRGDQSSRLEYDFSSGIVAGVAEEVKIAYGQFGSGLISMGSNNLGVSAFVHGDNSGYWLRAEVIDANGTRRFVDLEDEINWIGWKRVQGEINQDWAQPLVLRSIYVVRQPGVVKASAPLKGSIHIDYIEMIKGLGPNHKEEQDSGSGTHTNMKIARQDHDFKALNMRIIGNGMLVTLTKNEPTVYRISEPENPGEQVYQLGLWNDSKNRWELLPAARLVDTNELMFTMHQSGLYQLFLTPPSMLGFSDLVGHWGKEFLIDLVAAGTLHGYSDRTLRPDQSVTRAEFVVLLHRVFGQLVDAKRPLSTSLPSDLPKLFADSIPSWAKEAVVFATQLEIVQGYNDGTFRPQQQISRTEMAVLMGRTLQLVNETNETNEEINVDSNIFKDASLIPDWGKRHVEYMHEKKYLTGHEGYFRPGASATRAETAVVLWRVIQNQ